MAEQLAVPDFSAFTAAVFDLDGTLVHSEHAWMEAKVEVLRRHGISADQSLLDAHVGRGLRDFLDEAFGRTLSAREQQAIGNEIGAEADELLPTMREPVVGAADVLCHLHDRGLRIAICTASPMRHVLSAMDMLGISDRIETIVSASDLPRGKPDPLPYVTAVSQLEVLPATACAFEDSVPGVTSATAAGLSVLAVGPGCSGWKDFCGIYRAENYLHLSEIMSGKRLKRRDEPPDRNDDA